MKITRVKIDVAVHFSRALALLILTLLAALPLRCGAAPFATPSAAGPGTIPGIRMAICNSAVITGKVRHVSLSGNDGAADGSATHPYRTLYRAVQETVSNDTILVHGGTYQEPNEIRLRIPGVTIRSQPGEWAIIDRTTRGEWDSGIYFYVGSDYGVLTCIEVTGGFYVVSTETKWDWGDPNDRAGASHIRIENTRLHGSYADVIKIKPNSDDILIRYNEIFTSGVGQPSNDCNAEGIDNVNGDRTLVAYNHIHDICSTGVYLKGGATDGVVEYNLIERTGAAGILLGFDTSPEYFDTTVNPEYYENIGGIARYNLIRNPGWAGIGFYASKDAQAYRNTILNAAAVYHSPIYFGISYQDWEPTAGRPPNRNPSISKNVVVSQSVSRDPALIEIRYSNDLGGLSALNGNPRMSDNCYYRLAGAAAFRDQRTNWNGNLVAWQAHIQGDAGTYEGDPQLDANDQPRNPACAGRGYTWSDGPIVTTYTLSISKTGGNGTVTSNPAGIHCGTTCAAAFNNGVSAILTARADAGYRATGWSGDCNSTTTTCTVTMSADRSVTALFATLSNTLTVVKTGSGAGRVTGPGINCGVDCSETYPLNTQTTLTATAAAGAIFAGWTGCAANPTPLQCTVTMNAAKSVSAQFNSTTTGKTALTLYKGGPGLGAVNSFPPNLNCGPTCNTGIAYFAIGASITLTAMPATGSTFVKWTDCAPIATNPRQCTTTLNTGKVVIATFTRPVLTVRKVGSGLVVTPASTPGGIFCGADCTEPYNLNTPVTLVAIPAIGYRFNGWSDCTADATYPMMCRVTMNQARTATATFVK
jgi:hypothetical protein